MHSYPHDPDAAQAVHPAPHMRPPARRWSSARLRSMGLWSLASVAALAAVARLVSIAQGPPPDPQPDGYFSLYYVEHLFVVLLHLVPAVAFMGLGPLQFSASIRRRWPAWHRWSGRVFVISALAVGGTALWMNAFFPAVGGWLKYSANVVFGLLLIGSVIASMAAIFRRDIARHRAWMMRALAIGLGAATQRLLVVPLLLVDGLSDLTIGLSVWLGWLINLLVAEVILRRGRARARR